jgi:hypothetical protein
MNRSEFQTLAEVRIREAKALLDAQLWDGAYYLAGYALECGLKACILARVERTGEIFKDKKFSEKCWTHDLSDLLALADLEASRKAEATAKQQFGAYWALVAKWSEKARYERKSQADAEALYTAIADATDGVLRWIQQHW